MVLLVVGMESNMHVSGLFTLCACFFVQNITGMAILLSLNISQKVKLHDFGYPRFFASVSGRVGF